MSVGLAVALAACSAPAQKIGGYDAGDAQPIAIGDDASPRATDAITMAVDAASDDASPSSPQDAGSEVREDASDSDASGGDAGSAACPEGMVHIQAFCVDRYEAYVVEIDAQGIEQPHSPYDVVDGLTVRAKVAPQVQASAACASAGKRLCTATEFALACRGDDPANLYPYGGTTHVPGDCNEGKGSTVARFFGSDPSLWTYAEFNDPILNQWDAGLAQTGSYPRCASPYGVFDCVGNLHEWGADPPDTRGHGRFRGGFYGDAEINGHGCSYVTSAHEPTYHDYSTGFRCCADAHP
jgi:formylglycine-generating enzyme